MHSRILPPAPRFWRTAKLIGWNLLFIAVGLVVVGIGGEVYFRLTTPFVTESRPMVFVPGIGLLNEPYSEVRRTNGLDFWTVTPANSLGFLDREPISPEKAAADCHITIIGDSFVEAAQVPLSAKTHVQLEELAAARLPGQSITTSAFGIGGTGQTHQLPFYDELARRWHPKLVVLVFVPNDFVENSRLMYALLRGLDAEHIPYAAAVRNADGTMTLRPPDPDYRRFALPPLRQPWHAGGMPRYARAALRRLARVSYFGHWLDAKAYVLFPTKSDPQLSAWVERARERPGYENLFAGWEPTPLRPESMVYAREELSPVLEDNLDFTAFALDEFKARADRDGAALVILASHRTKLFGENIFHRLNEIAAALGLTVIDQSAYIHSQGAELHEANWAHNYHWNAQGHRWAAEALLEWLAENREVCDGPSASSG